MGVRFECPQGHKLHVKEHLAGKRGVCPECGARFIVPPESGGRVAEDAAPAPITPAASTVVAPAVAARVAQPLATQPAAGTNAAIPEPAVWYLRPPNGEQLGPAPSELFQQWVEEGRVAADCWVWRTGWADWKSGSEALALLGLRAPVVPVGIVAEEVGDDAQIVADGAPGVHAPHSHLPAVALPAGPITAAGRRAEMKRRKDRMRNVSILLGVVALLSAAALVVVLSL